MVSVLVSDGRFVSVPLVVKRNRSSSVGVLLVGD